MVFAGVTRSLLSSAERVSLSREALLTRAGLDPEELESPDGQIPEERHLALWRLICARSQDPCFGLHHGEWMTLGHIGPAGYAASSSPTLGAALSSLDRYSRVITEFLESSYCRRQAGAGMVMTLPSCRLSDDMADAAVASDVSLARCLTGRHIRPREVWLQRRPPPQRSEYERIFDCPILFEQRHNAVLYEPAALDLPLPSADPLLLLYLDRAFRANLAFRPAHATLYAELESAVLEQLAQGDVRIEQVAPRLGMSVRTLQRRLKDRGLEYHGLLDTVRQRLATELLANRLIPIQDICYRLGFSEPSAFRRAFKRWTGQSPSAYRLSRPVRLHP
ncbi:MAG TPA: AraC family transcriptional regulator [Kofleriaceae bacterium]|jgi:AraC-like DNA-binding protein|nr:AraC family transcriptional regulator [Kofleriaceae bacterium]